jgi:hypothetical protein
VAGEEHIGYDAGTGEQFDILKSPADAPSRYFMRVKAGNRLAIEDDLPDLGAIVAGHAVQQARLSRAVRSDNGQQLARFDVQIDILEGNQPAKIQTEIRYHKLSPTVVGLSCGKDGRLTSKGLHFFKVSLS